MADVPVYTSLDSVKLRLTNKVQFQTVEPALDGEVPDALLNQLIADAETMVEQDLRGRYAIPFRSKTKGKFSTLPDHSQRAIRTAVDQKSVINILNTDFGRGTHISAEGYVEALEKAYEAYISKLLGEDKEGKSERHGRYRFAPPLDDLLLAKSNLEADDGYKGRIINTDASCNDTATYAAEQINDPANTFIGGRGRGNGPIGGF